MMMGFSVIFILALIQFFTLCAGGNSEDLSNITDSSNHHHRLHPRDTFNRANAKKEEGGSAEKEKALSIFYINHLQLVDSKDPPEGADLVSPNKEDYYILVHNNCNNKVKVKALKRSETNPGGFQFLVNKDNFEILEWKTWAEIHSQITSRHIIICKNHVIVKDKKGISSVTIGSLKKSDEVLTLNYDIKGQDFQTEDCEEEEKVKPDKIKVIKQVTAENKSCKPAKYVVKFDQGSDRTISFLKSRTHVAGGVIEASASGKIFSLVEVGGKLTGKYDYTHLNSETTSNLDKDLQSLSMEVEIPPSHSCVIEIKSRTSTFEALCSGQLFRQYKNGDVRTTSITGIYNHQEVADLLTSVNSCKPLTDGPKCVNA